MTDWKALCAELLGELENEGHAHWPGGPDGDPLIEQTRAALAAEADGPAVPEGREPASVVGEPSDEEIMELMTQQMHDDLAAAVRAMAEQEGIDSTRAKGVMRIMLNRHVVDLARAALARFSHQSAPPAEGEVGELVAWLRDAAFDLNGSDPAKSMLTRAADLLEQRQAAPVPLLPEDAQPIEPTERTIMVPLQTPVPISERLPGPEDCDAEGKCWMGYWDSHVNGLGHSHKTWFWTLEDLSMVDEHTHWLPHHALPLPAGEVES